MTRTVVLSAAGLTALALAASAPGPALGDAPRSACPSGYRFVVKRAISARARSHTMVRVGEVYVYRRHKRQGSPAYDFASFCYVVDRTATGRRAEVDIAAQVFNHRVDPNNPIEQDDARAHGPRTVGRTRYDYTPATLRLRISWAFPTPAIGTGSVRVTARS